MENSTHKTEHLIIRFLNWLSKRVIVWNIPKLVRQNNSYDTHVYKHYWETVNKIKKKQSQHNETKKIVKMENI